MASNGIKIRSPREYCFDSIGKIVTKRPLLFSKNTTLSKITISEFSGWWFKLSGYLDKHPETCLESVFQDSIINFLDAKQMKKENIKDDKYYLYTIFRNAVYNYGKKKRPEVDTDAELPEPEVYEEPDNLLSNIDIANLLLSETALQRGGEFELKVEEISTFFSNRIYKWQLKEMEKPLHIKEGTLRSHNYRARQILMEFVMQNFTALTTEKIEFS